MSKTYTLRDLLDKGLVPADQEAALLKVAERFSVALSTPLMEAIEAAQDQNLDLQQDLSPDPNHHSSHQPNPMAQQFIPNPAELEIKAEELKEPLGEDHLSPVKGIVHRYPDRCLLMPLMVCPAYCRFCFRREKVSKKNQSLKPEELKVAIAYIQSHPEIWEVILTGGEPLMLKARALGAIIAALNAIEHVAVIRIHTRMPVVDPASVTQELVQALDSPKAVYVVLHANHPSELTSDTRAACARFISAGIPMLSQTVLLKGINDDPQIMGALMRALVCSRIKPYYLHHAELAEGTSHFRTSVQKGQKLMQSLRGHYSGLCQPSYVLDIPGGYGKVPIHKSYLSSHITAQEHGKDYLIEDYQGKQHCYRCTAEDEHIVN